VNVVAVIKAIPGLGNAGAMAELRAGHPGQTALRAQIRIVAVRHLRQKPCV